MMSTKVTTYLSKQQADADPDIANVFSKFEELYNKKLWHQLTLAILEALKLPYFTAQTGRLMELYDSFVSDFDHRINPLSLMEIAAVCVHDNKDAAEAIAFIERVKVKTKDCKEAIILADTNLGNIYITTRDLPKVKKLIEETQSRIEELNGVTKVHSGFYELTSNYYKLQGDHANFYREALRYLGCVAIAQIPKEKQMERAYSLSLAALLGEGVYNFGELLAHPILASIQNTDKQWIVDLLYAFNSGDISKFESYQTYWHTQPDLAAAAIKLRQKICLLSLMEMTFKRPSNNRCLTFNEISAETKLPVEEVEHLVMKALSLNLVKGSIDQVDANVTMTWVQPRVLDRAQLSTMQKRLSQWCQDVKEMQILVEQNAHDILT